MARALDSIAWSAGAAYQFDMAWQPKLSYRYAFFEGDDPATPGNEAFDGLFTGFSDWGTWWQGEIAGEYFIANSNLISHQLRLSAVPSEADKIYAHVIDTQRLGDSFPRTPRLCFFRQAGGAQPRGLGHGRRT